ncbi:hypothetical protein ACH5RR_008078 [Cinchona calisaya]|uniref:Uncharacterized protein n=1 Tax=Cinchona calisaya TaxID=153742 RepID=A0ABD3AAI3_9GENT
MVGAWLIAKAAVARYMDMKGEKHFRKRKFLKAQWNLHLLEELQILGDASLALQRRISFANQVQNMTLQEADEAELAYTFQVNQTQASVICIPPYKIRAVGDKLDILCLYYAVKWFKREFVVSIASRPFLSQEFSGGGIC